MYRNIIWDVDGTLFDTYPAFAGCFRVALLELGADAPAEWIESLAKVSMDHCLTTLADTYRLPADAISAGFDARYAEITAADQPPFPGVARVCREHAARGGRNFILTHRGQRGTEELLQVHGMEAWFSGMVIREDGFPRKPDPAAFVALLDRERLARAETITVGDRDIDILAGRAAGIATCFHGAPNASIPSDYSIASYGLFEAVLAAGGQWVPVR